MTKLVNNPELLRKLQLVEKDILLDVVRVCDKFHITYYLNGGTLLGAVRHGGFIPWDDDVDIEIPIKDYKLFLKVAQEALGESYFVQNFQTDPNFQFAFTRIRKNNTTFLYMNHREHHVHHGVWLDIFPQVALNDGISLKIKRRWISFSNYVQIGDLLESNKTEFKKTIGAFGVWLVKTFSKIPIKRRQKIHKWMLDRVFNADPKKCTYLACVWGNITSYFKKEIYEGEPKYLLFEGEKLRVPTDYKGYLEIVYGDYMTPPPPEKRVGHGGEVIVDLENSFEQYML